MPQALLFPDPKPLVERLGRRFFRKAPRRPGVYKMRDAADNVVYVGKAINLRQRLASYRIANPERMPRRHLRMLREVVRIEFDLCANEPAALKHEARLIRELKPKFNRAGVWQAQPRFLAWRFSDDSVEFAIQETPLPGWSRIGPLGGRATRLRNAMIRLLWIIMNPEQGFAGLPRGWARGEFAEVVAIHCGNHLAETRLALESELCLRPEAFALRLRAMLPTQVSGFDRAAMLADWETVQEFSTQATATRRDLKQMPLL